MAMVMENQQSLAPVPVVPAPPLPPPPPPPLPPPPQAYKHRCKVCKKGFMCGRALGGHMRAHGVTDDGLSADDDALDDDDDDDSVPYGTVWVSTAEAAAATSKRMYARRRHKNCRVCENCGTEFTSRKSLVDHGRCTYDREKDDFNIADADIQGENEDLALASGWSKGKRTRRTKVIVVDNCSQIDEPLLVPTADEEEEDLANCLVRLASSSDGVQPQAIVDIQQPSYASTCNGKCAQTSKNDLFLVPPQPISMLPPSVPRPRFKFLAPPQMMPSSTVPRGLFECKACKKVFTSHQALGGHRASHKKVKGCFAAKLEENSHNNSPQPSAASSNDKVVFEDIPAIIDAIESNGVDGSAEVNMLNARTTAVVVATSATEMANIMQVDEAPSSSTASPDKKKGKVHECSICHRVFMSGQALGGHKRCHWLTTGAGGDPTAAVAKLPFITQDHVMHAAMCQQLTLGPTVYGTSDSCLDLNVPMNQSADPAATRQAVGINESMLNLNAPASLYMHSWAGRTNASNMHNTAATSGHYDLPEATAAATEDDEADSTSAKRAKISDLKDMNMAGETSPWLQVGIALPSSETSEGLLKPKA